jgi:hypothetical protein
MHCLRSLGSRDRGFESHSGHECLVSMYVCAFFCVCVQVEALRRADHPSKESYLLFLIKKLRKLSLCSKKREQAPKCGSNEEERKKKYLIVASNYGASHVWAKCRGVTDLLWQSRKESLSDLACAWNSHYSSRSHV